MITLDELRAAIRALGLEGREVCAHTSLRSFGAPVENGAAGLTEAFLSCGCTLMVPAFCDLYERRPVKRYMPMQNGAGDYSYFLRREDDASRIYSPLSAEVTAEEMGALPAYLAGREDCARGDHPLDSFAAVGSGAARLISG